MFKRTVGLAFLRGGDCLLEGGDSAVPEEGNELMGLFKVEPFIVENWFDRFPAHLIFTMGMTIFGVNSLPFPFPTNLAETEFELISFNSIIETKERQGASNAGLCVTSWRGNTSLCVVAGTSSSNRGWCKAALLYGGNLLTILFTLVACLWVGLGSGCTTPFDLISVSLGGWKGAVVAMVGWTGF